MTARTFSILYICWLFNSLTKITEVCSQKNNKSDFPIQYISFFYSLEIHLRCDFKSTIPIQQRTPATMWDSQWAVKKRKSMQQNQRFSLAPTLHTLQLDQLSDRTVSGQGALWVMQVQCFDKEEECDRDNTFGSAESILTPKNIQNR